MPLDQFVQQHIEHAAASEEQGLVGRRVMVGLGAVAAERRPVAVPEDDAVEIGKRGVDRRRGVDRAGKGKLGGKMLGTPELPARPRCARALVVAPATALEVEHPGGALDGTLRLGKVVAWRRAIEAHASRRLCLLLRHDVERQWRIASVGRAQGAARR
eukprot:871082-Prymnesium_polylepis.1